jgi:threonine dehydratase
MESEPKKPRRGVATPRSSSGNLHAAKNGSANGTLTTPSANKALVVSPVAPITLSSIVSARLRLEGNIANVTCRESRALSAVCGCIIFTKREYLQQTGSFKERGACNALMLLTLQQRAKGVIAASAGNHALALAFHGNRLGIAVTVVMPVFAPMIKQARCRQQGARVILSGNDIAEAKNHAMTLVESEGLSYVHGFDGPEVIAGQGTIGLELIEQIPDLDAIVCPIGGGGLIAGVALAVKETSRACA